MEKILIELNNDNSVLIEQSDLPEFWYYVSVQKDYYGFRYEYIGDMVKIEMNYKHTIIKL